MNLKTLKKLIEKKRIPLGITLIILNFAIGFIAKIPFFELIANPHDFVDHPMYYVAAIIAYLFSWVIGIAGVILIGEETVQRIKKRMQRKMQNTYEKHVGQHVEKHVNVPMKKFVRKIKKKNKEFALAKKEKRNNSKR